MTEQLANFGETTVNEALDDSETTVTVTDGSVFPSSGNFRVLVDDELMLVTARSTNDLTVTRGAESTTAAAHDDGAAIRMVLTAASLPLHVQQSMWVNDVDNPLTSLTDITSGNGTWSINTYLQVVAPNATHCRAYVDNPTMTHAAIAIVEVEVEIPSSWGANDFIGLGWVPAIHVSTGNPGHIVADIIGDNRAYISSDGVTGIDAAVFTAPAAGTWVKMRLLRVGSQASFVVDGVLIYEGTVDVPKIDTDGIFYPMVHVYDTGGKTVRFRNLKAWSLKLP